MPYHWSALRCQRRLRVLRLAEIDIADATGGSAAHHAGMLALAEAMR